MFACYLSGAFSHLCPTGGGSLSLSPFFSSFVCQCFLCPFSTHPSLPHTAIRPYILLWSSDSASSTFSTFRARLPHISPPSLGIPQRLRAFHVCRRRLSATPSARRGCAGVSKGISIKGGARALCHQVQRRGLGSGHHPLHGCRWWTSSSHLIAGTYFPHPTHDLRVSLVCVLGPP